MNKNLEFVRAKCIEANPEILDLKFGCYIDLKTPYLHHHQPPITSTKIIDSFHDTIYIDGGMALGKMTKQDIETIKGRSIHLADVLLMFGERVHNDDRINDVIKGMTYSWNLKADSLEEQSEQTIDFIAKLLS